VMVAVSIVVNRMKSMSVLFIVVVFYGVVPASATVPANTENTISAASMRERSLFLCSWFIVVCLCCLDLNFYVSLRLVMYCPLEKAFGVAMNMFPSSMPLYSVYSPTTLTSAGESKNVLLFSFGMMKSSIATVIGLF